MTFRLRDVAAYRNDASRIWHRGTVQGVRRPASATDTRTFVRLEFGEACGHEEVEVNAVVLTLQQRGGLPEAGELCAGCWPARGTAQDRELGPDTAGGIDHWRDALERAGERLWYCGDCRSFSTGAGLLCDACGSPNLRAAESRESIRIEQSVTAE